MNPEDDLDEANKLFDKGNDCYKKGDYDKAIEYYTQAIALKPDYADAYNNRGLAYYEKKEYDKAIADYDKAIAINPYYANAFYNRGNYYSNKGDYDKAIEDYTKAIELEQDNAKAYNNRGNDYGHKGDHDKAIADYDKAIAIKPDYAKAFYNRGISYSDKGDYDKSIADYNQAIAINPYYANAFYNRGNSYSNKGDYDKAIEDYTKAIDLKPDNAKAYNNRGNDYGHKGDHDKAIADYNQTIAIKPDYAKAFYNRGISYSNKGDEDKAIEDYTKAIELEQDNAEAYNNRGVTYSNKKEYDKAIADYKQAIILEREWTSLIAPRIIDIENRKIDEPVANCVKAIKEKLEYNADELSHYTSIDVGVKLLCNNSPFRFSMAAEVNDPSEGKMLWKLLGITDEVEEKREEATSRMEVDNPVFIGCFVHKENDLNMFRFYGKDKGQEAAGCNIVYKTKAIANALKDKSSTEVNSLNNQNYTFYNVVYWDNGDVYYVGGEKKDDLIELMDDLKKAVEDFKNSETYTKDNLNKILSSIRYLFKHSFYKEEQECRIVIYGVPLTDKKVETVYEGGVFRTFIPQEFPADAAHKLIVGPRVKDFHSLENFFKVKKGKDSRLKFTVEKSNLPFQ